MWIPFYLENLHFAINLFMALVFLAVAWLYFDAWMGKKYRAVMLKAFGFVFLTLSFLVQAVTLETVFQATPLIPLEISGSVLVYIRMAGYLLLIAGVLLEQPAPRPTHSGQPAQFTGLFLPGLSLAFIAAIMNPVLSVIAAFLFLRRSTTGLEHHLKPVSFGFYLLAASELIGLGAFFRDTTDVRLFMLVKPYGTVWILEHLFLLFAAIVIGKWIFGYLLKQIRTQLYMIFSLSALVIFLATTFLFTFLLVKNVEREVLSQLTTDVRVFSHVLDSKKAELLSDSQALSMNPLILDGLDQTDRTPLSRLAETELLAKKKSSVRILDAEGRVIVRGEDADRWGDSLSDDALVKRALGGQPASGIISGSGQYPVVTVAAVYPILQGNDIAGVVQVTYDIDQAFADGVKSGTGLDTLIFGGDTVAAGTVTVPGVSGSLTGLKVAGSAVSDRVLKQGSQYTGEVALLSEPYIGVYSPINDLDVSPVGMIFIGKSALGVLTLAAASIELTFLFTAVLLILSIIPASIISKYIADQL